ncbi:hypothetical protein P7C70_g7823, partial [Phenoliferia sp. Uapishka_3]
MAHLGHWRQLTPRERFHRFAPFTPCDTVTTLYIPDNISYDLVASTSSGNHGLRALPHRFETSPEWEPDVVTTISGMRELCKPGAKVVEIPPGHRALLQYGQGFITHMIKDGAEVDIYGRGSQHVNLYGFAEEQWSHPLLSLDYQDPEHHGYISQCLIERAVEGCGRRRAQGLSRLIELAKGEGGLGGLSFRQIGQSSSNLASPFGTSAPPTTTASITPQPLPKVRQITPALPSSNITIDQGALKPPPHISSKSNKAQPPPATSRTTSTTGEHAQDITATVPVVPAMTRAPAMNAPMAASTTQGLTPSQRRRIRKLAARTAAEVATSQASSPSPTSCRASIDERSQEGSIAKQIQSSAPLEANTVQDLTVIRSSAPASQQAPSQGAASGQGELTRTFASVAAKSSKLNEGSTAPQAPRKRKNMPPQGNTSADDGRTSSKNSRVGQGIDKRSKVGSPTSVESKQGPIRATDKASNTAALPAKVQTQVAITSTTAPPPKPAQLPPQGAPLSTNLSKSTVPIPANTSTAQQTVASPTRAPYAPPRASQYDERLTRTLPPRGFQDQYWSNGYHDRDYYGGNGYERRGGDSGFERQSQGKASRFDHGYFNYEGSQGRYVSTYPSYYTIPQTYNHYSNLNYDDSRPSRPIQLPTPVPRQFEPSPSRAPISVPQIPSKGSSLRPNESLRVENKAGSTTNGASSSSTTFSRVVSPPPTSRHSLRPTATDFFPSPGKPTALPATSTDPRRRPSAIITGPLPSSLPARPATIIALSNVLARPALPAILPTPILVANTAQLVANSTQATAGGKVTVKVEEGEVVESKLDQDGWELVKGKGKAGKWVEDQYRVRTSFPLGKTRKRTSPDEQQHLQDLPMASTSTSIAVTGRPPLRRSPPYLPTLSTISAMAIDNEWTTDMDIDPSGERALHLAETWELTKSRRQSKVDERSLKSKRHRSSQEFYKWLRAEEQRLWEEFKKEYGPLRIGGIREKDRAPGLTRI